MVDPEALDLYVSKNKNLKCDQCWILIPLTGGDARLKYQTSRYLYVLLNLFSILKLLIIVSKIVRILTILFNHLSTRSVVHVI